MLHVLKTAMAAVSNAQDIKAVLNFSQSTSQYATARHINSADGSIVEAEASTKINEEKKIVGSY